MSSDDSTRSFVPGFRQLGTGHLMQFQCLTCMRPRHTMGRKKTPMGWRCAECVRIKAAQKAAA